jgi:hypothetical protein
MHSTTDQMSATTGQMTDFNRSTTNEMIAIVKTYLQERNIPEMKIDIERIPEEATFTYNERYTRGIMVIPKATFIVDDTIRQLVITGFHMGYPKSRNQPVDLGTPASIGTSTGGGDKSPKIFFLESKEVMIKKLDEILKVRTNEPFDIQPSKKDQIPETLTETLQKILHVLEMIEKNTLRPA